MEPKERPILFSAPMVRAIIDGRKTQTRRVCRIQPTPTSDGFDLTQTLAAACPYGKPGDQLWVRETWAPVGDDEDGPSWIDYRATPRYPDSQRRAAGWDAAPDDADAIRWRPSIHMPRWASRLTLVVKSVRVERLQDITDGDARAEGVVPPPGNFPGATLSRAVYCFADLWDEINMQRGYPWDSNPWVWVVSFRIKEKSQ